MTDETSHLIFEMLREIRPQIDKLEADMGDAKVRMSSVEHNFGQVQIQLGALNGRMDRFDERLSRIERRLELVDV